MRYDEAKSFPYPVLRPGSSDYTDGAFQATVRWGLSGDTQTIQIKGRCQLSEPAILELIRGGRATYAILLESRETYFRDLITSDEPRIERQYGGGKVKGRVELFPFVVVNEAVSAFRSELFHSEYGNQAFDLEVGDVVALDSPRSFYVGQEVFTPIGSVFSLVEEDGLRLGETRLDLDNERIHIRVSPEQKELLDNAREQQKLRPLLLNGVYLPTLMQVLSYMATDPEEFAAKKWARSIQAKCDLNEIELNERTDVLAVALTLLGYPLNSLNKKYFETD